MVRALFINTFLFLISLSFAQDVQKGEIVTRDSLVHQYNQVEKWLIPRILYRDTLFNTSGYYAWRVAEFLRSEILMYEATGHVKYLEAFTIVADTVLSRRDDRRNLTDWRGIAGPGWSCCLRWNNITGKYIFGLPMRDLMQDACIIYPFLKFATVVRKDSVKLFSFIIYADRYIQESMVTMNSHIAEDYNNKKNEFIFPKGSPIWADGSNVPNNYESQAGSNLLLLYNLTGNISYKEIVEAISSKFKNRMKLIEGSYVWHYWDGKGFNGWKDVENISENTMYWQGQKDYEDLSHSDNDVSFIIDCVNSKIIFDSNDVKLLLKTFKSRIDKNTYLSRNVFGIDDSVKGSHYHGPYYWLDLAKYDIDIFYTFYRIFYNGKYLPMDIMPLALLSRLISNYP